jgi:phosphonate transport system substrate-binding protein
VALLAALACDARREPIPIDLADTVDPRGVAISEGEKAAYQFGFDLRGGPERDAGQYLPFLRYLERATGYRFRLHFTPRAGSIGDDLGQGRVHFAAIGPAGYVLARDRYGIVPLARGVNGQGKAEYQGLIVVRPDSPVHAVEDLRGRRMAFGNATSTQGHVLPRLLLLRHGIHLEDLAFHEYTASHRDCANALLSGRFDACGIQDVMARALASEGLVRVIAESEPVPSSLIAAHGGVPAEVRSRVKAALLAFQPLGRDAPGLVEWDWTEMARGFVDTRDDAYDGLRRSMTRLGLRPDDAGAAP